MDGLRSPLFSDDIWTMVGAVIWCAGIVAWAALRWIPNRRSRRVRITTTSRTPSERFSMIMSSAGLGIVPAAWVFSGWPSALDHAAHPLLVAVGLA